MPLSCQDLANALDRLLQTAKISDSSQNGLQVDGRRPVKKIALAVDACLPVFQAAQAQAADLIIVHHGLFWNKPELITGTLYARLKVLLEQGMGLYASHLPLDLHPRFGNNAVLARKLHLQALKPFGTYHGQIIGVGGNFSQKIAVKTLQEKMKLLTQETPQIFVFGKKHIRTLAIISGGGGDMASEAAAKGYDAFLTGELTHSAYYAPHEQKITVFACGHYATETFGVRALGEYLTKTYKIPAVFLDFPTGL